MEPMTDSIIVIGGGIVAASVAYHLARRDVSVTVVAGNQTGPATNAGAGIVCPWAIEDDGAAFRLWDEGARHYPDLIAMLAEDGQAETGYAKVGAIRVAESPEALRPAEDTLRARRSTTPQIGDITQLAPGEPARLFPPLHPGLAGLAISGGARVDGRAIRDSLLAAAQTRGATVLRGDAELEAARADGAAGRVTGVRVGADLLRADAVVVAAGAWTPRICAGFGPGLAVTPQRGQIVHALLPGADTAGWPVVLPGHDPYLLAFAGGRVVFGATREDAGFDYRVTVGGVSGLLAEALAVAPGLREATLLETRVGFRPRAHDGLPLAGRLADGLFVATGHGPEGLTAGPWTGLAVAALVLGEPPVTDLTPFAPDRPRPRLPSTA
jgi:D-amino-acid dehydrogenase